MESANSRTRRRVGAIVTGAVCVAVLWFFAPAMPVLWEPSASAATRESGRALFEHEWTAKDPMARGDGLGPVFNARSCVACHFQGGVGGGGSIAQNVRAFEVLPSKDRPEIRKGLIHASAVEPAYQETADIVKQLFPIIRGGQRVINGCAVQVGDLDPIRMESVNTPALFGAGWLDRISDRNITQAWRGTLVANATREFRLEFDATPAGRPRSLPGGRVGRFGWKAQFATLAEFVAAACANELGLGNPLMDQAKPLGASDYAAVPSDLSRRQFRELVAFVDTLPRPTQVLPDDPPSRAGVERGETLFRSVGCAVCHTPDVGGVQGVYSDFLLHKIENPNQTSGYRVETVLEVALPNEHPLPEEWKTPPLWGVADSAPYFHDGHSATLEDAILRHRGDGSRVTEAYRRLAEEDRKAIVIFLKSLKAPAEALPVTDPSAPVRVARAPLDRGAISADNVP